MYLYIVWVNNKMAKKCVLVHLASGIGNIVLATPLLIALSEMDYEIDVLLHADYPEMEQLLKDWRILRRVINGHEGKLPGLSEYTSLIPAIPPYYWQRYGGVLAGERNLIPRPNDNLFYLNEQAYYLVFANKLGYPVNRQPKCYLPVVPSNNVEIDSDYLVLAPGSKTGEMSKKRWPYFPQLAERFENVVIVGTEDDMYDCFAQKYVFPSSVRLYVGNLSLKESAEMMASAKVVVGNDNGLSHLAAAIGVQTIIIFGPTPDSTFGTIPPNATVLRSGLECEPCWFTDHRFEWCKKRLDCLNQIEVDIVEEIVASKLGVLAI